MFVIVFLPISSNAGQWEVIWHPDGRPFATPEEAIAWARADWHTEYPRIWNIVPLTGREPRARPPA